jgi:hypothetical protein
MTGSGDRSDLLEAFGRAVNEYERLTEATDLPRRTEKLSDLLVTGMLVKLLRLAGAALALARAGYARDGAPIVRTLLLVYVNMRFLATFQPRDEAAAAYVMHSERTLGQLKTLVLRDDESGGFPTRTAEEWSAAASEVDGQMQRIKREGIRVMRKFRPPGPDGRARPILDQSWTGMSERDLFEYVGDQDGYRFYALHSNDLHANVTGLDDVFAELAAGQVSFESFDVQDASRLIVLAAKYVLLAMQTFNMYHEIGIDSEIDSISAQFERALR